MEPNISKTLENSWRCYLATIAFANANRNYYTVCCEAVRSDHILATAWRLVLESPTSATATNKQTDVTLTIIIIALSSLLTLFVMGLNITRHRTVSLR